MKRIGKFLVFKVLELAGAFIVWWGLSWYGYWIITIFSGTPEYEAMLNKWLLGPWVGLFGGIVLPVLACFGLYEWIKWNWEKAGE